MTTTTPTAAAAPAKKPAAKPAVRKTAVKPAVKAAAKRPAKATAAATKKPVVKTAAAAKPAVKPVVKRGPKPAVKSAVKPVAKPAAKKAAPAKAAKPLKVTPPEAPKLKKVKQVRDSFTMPEPEYAVISQVKKACLKAGFEIKKSDLLRIGVSLIKGLDVSTLKIILATLTPLKAGRPKK